MSGKFQMIKRIQKEYPMITYLFGLMVRFLISMVFFCFLLTFIPDISYVETSKLNRFLDHLEVLMMFEFGYSMNGTPIWEVIYGSGIITLYLITSAIVVIIAVVVPLSYYTVMHNQSTLSKWIDHSLYAISSIPILVLSILFMALVTSTLNLVPIFNQFTRASVVVKILILSLPVLSIIFGDGIFYSIYDNVKDRITKIKSEPWFKGILARGGNPRKHVLRGIVETLMISITGKITYLVSGIIIVEMVFSWQGLGMLIVDIFKQSGQKDYPLLIAIVAVLLITIQSTNAVKELTLQRLNPEKRDVPAIGS